MNISRSLLLALSLLFVSCGRPSQPQPSPSPTPSGRWVLLGAPHLLPTDCEHGEPCTGTVYVRAPLADWERLGEYKSWRDCAASMSSNDPDAAAKDTDENHKQGKLTKAERMLGLMCVQTNDSRLLSPPPYDWEKESLGEP
jgi:hypothetical protein